MGGDFNGQMFKTSFFLKVSKKSWQLLFIGENTTVGKMGAVDDNCCLTIGQIITYKELR